MPARAAIPVATKQANKHIELRLARGVTLRLAHVPAGEFVMGSRGEAAAEEPMHRVRITREFWLGVAPVTQRQLCTCPSFRKHKFWFPGNAAHPADQVTWDQARRYASWLGGRIVSGGSVPPGYAFDLPTEAQWEYACRGGGDCHTEYASGDGEAALLEMGWFEGNAGGSTKPVRKLPPNSFGLHDMHGNVDEWCRDAWDEHAYARRVDGASDPEVTAEMVGDDQPPRVVRGGTWNNSAWRHRSAYRFNRDSDDLLVYQGFRVGLFPARTR